MHLVPPPFFMVQRYVTKKNTLLFRALVETGFHAGGRARYTSNLTFSLTRRGLYW